MKTQTSSRAAIPVLTALFYLTLCSLAVLCVNKGLNNSQAGSLAFFHNRNDYFMDLFHTVRHSVTTGTYTEGMNVYPPILLAILRLVSGRRVGDMNGFAIRNASLGLAIAAIVLSSFVFFDLKRNRSLGHDGYAAELRSFTAGLLMFCAPYTTFLYDRMNLLIVPVVSFYAVAKFALVLGSGFGAMVVVAAWCAAVVKPYFLLSLIALRLYGVVVPFKRRDRAIAFDILLYAMLNQLPFVKGIFHGSIIVWLQNIFSFSSRLDPISTGWDMSHYSVSPTAVVRALPFTSAGDFLQRYSLIQEEPKVLLVIGYLLTGVIIGAVAAFSGAIIRTCRTALRTMVDSEVTTKAFNLGSIAAALLPVWILLAVQKSIGYYAAALLLVPFALAFTLAEARFQWLMIILLSIQVLVGSLPASPFVGIVSLCLTWLIPICALGRIYLFCALHFKATGIRA